MIRHLFKLIWNRKRANALIVLEIVACFLVLFAVATLGVYYVKNYGSALGFQYDNVINVAIDVKQESDDYWSKEQIDTVRQLLLSIRDFEEVDAAAGALTVPFALSSSTGTINNGGPSFEVDINEVTDDLPAVLGLEVTRGRFFGREDNGSPVEPAVINESLAHNLFGDADPLGQTIQEGELRVVGVIRDYRRKGDLAAPGNVILERRTLEDDDRPPRNILIKVKPGASLEFEQRLLARLRAIAPLWSFDVSRLPDDRASLLQVALAPIASVGMVACFLILMVALGLMGILWQNVSRRRPEIGVRRAQGATARDIFAQIVGETAALTSVSLLLGCVILAQLPFLGVVDIIGGAVYGMALAISVVTMYVLTTMCSLYPSWLATRVQPAEALHYD